jgi:PilZ domain-containing protein
MSEETSDGTAYLLALKGSDRPRNSTAAAVAHAREVSAAIVNQATIPANSEPPYLGAEKRRTRRYRCDGTAELVPIDSQIRTWATFKDISMHGCYLEMAGYHPVGTVLNLTLQASGFRIQAEGVVRVSYPGVGMGIAFQRVSEEDRKVLKDLLQTISQPTTSSAGNAPPADSSVWMEALPVVLNPSSAVKALVTYFATRQSITRIEFARVLQSSQELKPAKP